MKKLTFAYLLSILFFIAPSAHSITEPGGAYATDKSNRSSPRVYTLAFQPGQLWDYLLCMSKSGKENHPNENWIIMIDNKACLIKTGFSTSIDPDAGNVPDYEKSYLSSTRADNNSNQVIKGWKINKDNF